MLKTSTVASPGETSLEQRVAALNLEQKVRLLTGADFWSLNAEPAVGLRSVVVSDGPAGVRGVTWDERNPSANVPSPTALGATWDVVRVRRLGRLLAAECRRKQVDVLLAPTVNLQRSPYGGRHFEMFGEDPLLTAQLGAAYVDGLQSAGVGATVKHFVANDSETERYDANIVVDERTLRELYLAPFEMIVKEAGVWAVMAAYNRTNGVTNTESPLLREVLQTEWAFDGVTMTDWFAGRSTNAAGNSGLDVMMPGPAGPWGTSLVHAVREGLVSEEAINDKVLRLLRLAGRVGALDDDHASALDDIHWSDDDLAAELRSAAAASFVLVSNKDHPPTGAPVLPLNRAAVRRVAILGPNAARGRTLGGGSALVFPPYTVSPLAGLTEALGAGVTIDYAAGVRAHRRLSPADVDQLTVPEGGERGVRLDFLSATGETLATERRRATAFNWHGGFGDVDPAQLAACRVHTLLRAEESGTYQIGGSGLGRFILDVDGVEQFDVDLALPFGADPAEALMRPPQHGHAMVLRKGQVVEIVLTHEPTATETTFASSTVAFQLNVEPPDVGDDVAIQRAVDLASAADVAILVVGTNEEVESEGFDRESLALPGRQDELIARVAKANARTVVVVNSGSPVLLPWRDDVAAILLTWFPGQEFGNALADVLLGDVEPGGRLPTTWPAHEGAPLLSTHPVDGQLTYAETIHIGHRGFLREGVDPAYWFGHGLGYTTWSYAEPTVESDGAGGATVTVGLTNTGGRVGREVVQLYAARPESSLDRPVRWLAGFATAVAEPGQQVNVSVTVRPRAFQHWDVAHSCWAVEPGTFELHLGKSAADISFSTRFDPSAVPMATAHR